MAHTETPEATAARLMTPASPSALWSYDEVRAMLMLALGMPDVFEEAVLNIEDAIPRYVHPKPEMTAEEFAGVGLGAVDNARVCRSLRRLRTE